MGKGTRQMKEGDKTITKNQNPFPKTSGRARGGESRKEPIRKSGDEVKKTI